MNEQARPANVDLWKLHLRKLIAASPIRMPSRRISEQTRTDEDQIPKATIDKWRSAKARDHYPKNRAAVDRLCSALEKLGAFGFAETKAKAQLYSLLGYQPTDDGIRLSEICAKAVAETERKIETLSPSKRNSLEPLEAIIACACTISQDAYAKDLGRLKAMGSRVMIFLLWDTRNEHEGEKRRNTLMAELTKPGVAKFIEESFVSKRIPVQVVLAFWPAAPSSSGETVEIQNAVERALNPPGGTHRPRDEGEEQSEAPGQESDVQMMVATMATEHRLPEALYLWAHLHAGGIRQAWRMVRHEELFRWFQDSRASTFCSPLSASEFATTCRAFNVEVEWIAYREQWRVSAISPAQ